MPATEEVLKKYWGYDSFRPLQKEIIESVLEGRDVLALLPTGGGKSICFQVPSLCMEGICVVISPLIALMKDQVANLKKKGIPALALHSGMNYREIRSTLENAAYGNFKFLYLSPERLETELFLEFLPILKLNILAVDEAHCISQWGYDFRPSYLKIAVLREMVPTVPILALTASATVEVQKDICARLLFRKNSRIFQQSFARPNLSFSSFEVSSKQNKIISILQKVPGTALVYCKSRKRTKEIADLLSLNGIAADYYHAGLNHAERNRKQEDWINNKVRVIACTNAFGMGIDKPDVRIVIHADVPDALENYYQEAGRAGRDGKKSYAVLLFNKAELAELNKQPDIKYPSPGMIRQVYAALCNHFQLPSGLGEGLSYDFDLNSFVKNFKFESNTVNNVLKILEQEELLNYSEQFFSPSKVVFTTDKTELYLFESSYPEYVDVIKGLLRSYGGIFDFPATISEEQLSRIVHIKKEDVVLQLQALQTHGMLEYTAQKEKPQVSFLQNRVKAEYLRINETNLQIRKKAFIRRLRAMVNFTLNKEQCRSVIIGNYFNDFTIAPCGVCDNCLEVKRTSLTDVEFSDIFERLKDYLTSTPVPIKDVYIHLADQSKRKVIKVVNWMQAEEIIIIDRDGRLRAKKRDQDENLAPI